MLENIEFGHNVRFLASVDFKTVCAVGTVRLAATLFVDVALRLRHPATDLTNKHMNRENQFVTPSAQSLVT